MCTGYLSNLDMYTQPIVNAVAALEAKLVAGVMTETELSPMITDLGSKIEKYGTGIKQIKAVYATERENHDMCL